MNTSQSAANSILSCKEFKPLRKMNVFQAGTQGVMPIIRGNLNPASTIGYQKWEDTLSCQICNEKQKHS